MVSSRSGVTARLLAHPELIVFSDGRGALFGDEPCGDRNKEKVWRFNTLRRSPSVSCASPLSRSVAVVRC